MADFLFNTHRYVFAIDFYEEFLRLLSLLSANSELSSFTKNELSAYTSSMTDKLEMTRRHLQGDHAQETPSEQQSRSKTSHSRWEESEAANEQRREIAFFVVLGSTFYSLSRYRTSIWYYEKAAEKIKATGDKLEEQRIYTRLAVALNAVNQFDKALSLQLEALQLSREIGDLKGELECYNNLGSLYNGLGQYDLAVDYYSKGLDVNDRMAAAMAHNNLGNVYLTSSQYLKSIDHYKESLRIRSEIGDTQGMSITYNNFSCVFYALGQHETAIACQEKAAEISERNGAKKQVAVSSSNLGGVYQALGKHQLSLDNHYKGLKIRREMGDSEGECRSYKEMSFVYDALGQLRDSLTYHEKALNLERAIMNKEKKIKTLSPHDHWIAYQERGLEIIEEIGEREGERLILFKTCLCHFSRLEVHKASDHLVEGIKNYETIRIDLEDDKKMSVDEQSVPLYKTLALMLISFEHYTDALLTLEQGRARALVDLVLRKYAIQQVATTNFANLSGLTSFFATQKKNFLFLATVADCFCLWFIDKLGNLCFKSYFVTKEIWHDSLLNYFRSSGYRTIARPEIETEYTEWETPSSRRRENLRASAEIVELLAYPSEEDERRSVPFLHQVIFGLAEELPDDEEIIVVPEGPMFQVPFEALQSAKGSYLVEKVRIRVIPSLTTLKILNESAADYHSKVGALLVGDPCVTNLKSIHLLPLPFARKEVEMIGELLGVQESCLTGSKATKREVLRRISGVSLVHIAAHASAERGEIALAGDEFSAEEDWLLSMKDVANVGLEAKLVVLSTCHSGRGTFMTGEGVVGIARAFLGSGARAVVMSLWAIDDEATLLFMNSFYKCLFVHKMSASRALRQSMKEMRDSTQYSDVKYWAPFVLYGEDVTLDLNEIRA